MASTAPWAEEPQGAAGGPLRASGLQGGDPLREDPVASQDGLGLLDRGDVLGVGRPRSRAEQVPQREESLLKVVRRV